MRVAAAIKTNGGDPDKVIQVVTAAIGEQSFDNVKAFRDFLRGLNLKYLGVKALPSWLADDTFAMTFGLCGGTTIEGEADLVAYPQRVRGASIFLLILHVPETGPDVIARIGRIAANYPKEWTDSVNASGRTVEIDLGETIRVGGEEGDRIELSGNRV